MSPRYLVLTPGAAGSDGISAASRLVVRALPAPDGPGPRVDLLAMGDAPGGINGDLGPGVRVRGAGGGKLAFVRAALAARALAGAGTHVLCLHAHLSPLAALLAGRRGRLSTVLHGVEAWRPLGRLERWALRRSRLIAVSEHTRRRFAEANPDLVGGPLPIQVCHLGVASGAGPPPLTAAAAAPFALVVGRMAAGERYKGHDLLIDIWPRVLDEVPGAGLVVVGDGDDRARLEARARALGERVRFAGEMPRAELDDLYGRSAFFVMPSRGEGFGLVFLEAMRAGRACIGGLGAAAEIIEDGVTGCLVDPGDPDAVLEAVLRLFREPATRERMGRAGAALIERRFTEAHFGRRFRAALAAGPA